MYGDNAYKEDDGWGTKHHANEEHIVQLWKLESTKVQTLGGPKALDYRLNIIHDVLAIIHASSGPLVGRASYSLAGGNCYTLKSSILLDVARTAEIKRLEAGARRPRVYTHAHTAN